MLVEKKNIVWYNILKNHCVSGEKYEIITNTRLE